MKEKGDGTLLHIKGDKVRSLITRERSLVCVHATAGTRELGSGRRTTQHCRSRVTQRVEQRLLGVQGSLSAFGTEFYFKAVAVHTCFCSTCVSWQRSASPGKNSKKKMS